MDTILSHCSSVCSSIAPPGAADAGVVHEDVDLTLALEHRSERGSHAGVVVDVELDHLGVDALVADHLGEVALAGVPHAGVDAVAAATERQRRLVAEPRAAPRDHDDAHAHAPCQMISAPVSPIPAAVLGCGSLLGEAALLALEDDVVRVRHQEGCGTVGDDADAPAHQREQEPREAAPGQRPDAR